MRTFYTIILLFLFKISFAQYSFKVYNQGKDTIQVFENGKNLKYPFAGGLNNPQFSTVDLNFDGIQDLIVFERECSRLSTFINLGIPNQRSYVYAPEYQKYFPEISVWSLMIDYNGDGKNDIFCHHPSGVTVYKNISTIQSGLKFQRMIDYLKADYGTFKTNLIAQAQDIPAIIDIDGDGDLDIFSFGTSIDSSGESVYWFRNYSKERYNNLDSLEFDLEKECWGRFRESFTDCKIKLNYASGICGSGGKSVVNSTFNNSKHTGSTLLIFDANSDNKYDLLLGDISCSNAYLLLNGTNNIIPIMDQVIYHYPTSNPIDIVNFPASYYLDINNDNLKDLISAPNTGNGSINTNQVKLYTNNGSNSINKFDFSTNSFLIEEMIDVAQGSAPSFVDFNKDGLMDIVISNTGYWDTSNNYTTGLALYKNIGTSSLAKFELQSRDWLGLSTLNIANMAPSFGDMDGDGDQDMVCGSNDGTLHFFRNFSSAGAEMNLQYVANYFGTIDVGNFSAPFIYDFEGDGKNEVIVGERFDNVNVLSNTGSLVAPNFVLLTDSLYKINLKAISAYPSGRARLSIQTLRPNEAPSVMISNGNGKIYNMGKFNADMSTPLTIPIDSLNLESGIFSNSYGGFYFSMADLNNDQKPELIAGNPQGGVVLFRNTSLNVGIESAYKPLDLSIYPNPATDNIYIRANDSEKFSKVQLLDLNGKVVVEINEENSFQKIDTKNLPSGMYIIRVLGSQSIYTGKIILNSKF